MTTANEHGCYCPDCAGSWIQNDKDTASSIRVCGCPCHTDEEEDVEGAEEWSSHDDTCDCDECCGDDMDEDDLHEEGPVPGCNCHDCIQ